MPTSRYRFTIMGCGSSGGVPRVGGFWGSCNPENPRNHRRRCAMLVERFASDGEKTVVLVDAGPDLRMQLLDAAVEKLDAVLISHEHADHIHGLDDIRGIYLRTGRVPIPLWTSPAAAEVLRTRFGYAFHQEAGSGYAPILTLNEFQNHVDVEGAGGTVHVQAYTVPHGSISAMGFRFGPLAYTPDLSDMSDAAWEMIAGVDTWVVDALQRKPHPTHTHLAQTLEWIARLAPRRAVITNMHTDMDYDELSAELPDGIIPAHDGLVLELAD